MRFLFSIIFSATLLYAQAQHSLHIDSLNQVLKDKSTASEKAYTLDELSYEWFSQNLDSSLIYGQKSLVIFNGLDDPKGLSQALTSVAVAYHYLNTWDSAEYYYIKALKVRQEDGNMPKIASSLNNLGVMFMDMEDYQKATEYYIKAMEVREEAGDVRGAAITKSNLGLIFKKQGIYDKAIAYYKEAKEQFEQLEQLNYVEIALLNLGSIYNTLEEYPEGVKYNLQLRQLAEKRSSKRNLAKSYVNLANSYQGLGFLDSSLFYVAKALDFFEATNDTLNIAQSLLSRSYFLMDQREFNIVIANSKRLEQLNLGLSNKEMAIENQLLLSKAYAAVRDYGKAYAHLQSSYNKRDSFLTKSLNETISDLTLKYESEQKEREISELKVANQEALIASQSSANQRNIFILVAGIFVLGVGLLYLLLRAKSKSNTIIARSLNEKETLLKEIHHRVKNNLQVISSLLSLQSRFIEDRNAQELVNEGQNRVKSMALIHQKLYQHDNLTGVDAIDYIQNLTGTLKKAYGVDDDQVIVSYDIEKMNLDVDTMIPIGLILNELISNSFKHAFPNGNRGELDIVFKEEMEKLRLVVKDDGIGSSKYIEDSDSFGMRLIRSLSRKLEAEVDFNFHNGTEALLTISSYKLYN
ncbi:MAG: histidine kinase dimerization/phosphoacceptor domain -containing protein [Bacteroidota bacterium]